MKKKVVVVGYGGMGGWHTGHLLKSDVAELKGIYDIKEERSELARSRGIYAYPSLEAVLADPEVDLITVATPNECHRPIAVQALNAGKNVISEKPVTLSCADLQAMIDAANKAGKIFSVHQNRRWDVDFLAMKKIYDEGLIGDVFSIESRIHGSRGIPSDWRGEKEHGGGMLYDWGIHLIDQILQIIQEDIEKIYCRFEHLTNDEVDDGFMLEIEFASGKTAYIETCTYNFISMPRFYMRGRDGTAIITDWTQNCKIVKCKHWHESDVVPVETAAGLTKTMAPRDSLTTDEFEIERPASDVHNYYRNICATLDGKATQHVTHPQMQKVLKVIERAFESVEKGQVIDF